MDFKKDYSAKQSAVETALKKYFAKLDKKNTTYFKPLYEAMNYSLFAGGKRFRPVLSLLVYEAFKPDFEICLPSACALEYIHTYSLIHDDLPSIDNDDMRRGKPTCHKKFGEAIAILAGDALFAEAFHLISKEQKASAQVLQDIIRELSEAIGVWGMVGGQVADVITSREEANLEALYFIHSHKTGKLIVSAAKMGARLAEVTSEKLAAIEKYAFHLGMAFQITDDILDEVGDSSLMGKNIGSDKKQKKVTYPAVFGLEKAQKEATQSAEAAIESLKDIKSENLERLARFVVQRSS